MDKRMQQVDQVRYYHAHLYYDAETLAEAKALGAKAHELFGIKQGTYHERPVGPHPVWSCQLTVPTKLFGDVIPWLALNRGRLDVFVHPVTGDDLKDHTFHVMWLGRSYELDLKGFAPTAC